MAEFNGQIPFFLESFLGKPASALPKGSQWVMVFEGAFSADGTQLDYTEPLPVPAILNTIKYEPRKWNVEQALKTTLGDDYQTTKGCLFVQAVQIPGENNVANPEGLQQGGFLRSYVGGGRDPLEPLQVTFLDTNVSFVESVIRPWLITTAYLGLIARSGRNKNYRCNISIYKLGVLTPEQNPYVLRKYTFYGVCPVNISGEEFNYTQTTSPVNREVTFLYHYYSLDTDTNNFSITNNNKNLPVPLSTKDLNQNVIVP
jgi:hypothetical protein